MQPTVNLPDAPSDRRADGALALENVSALLSYALRHAGSDAARQPGVWLLSRALPELAPGLYRYAPDRHQLATVSARAGQTEAPPATLLFSRSERAAPLLQRLMLAAAELDCGPASTSEREALAAECGLAEEDLHPYALHLGVERDAEQTFASLLRAATPGDSLGDPLGDSPGGSDIGKHRVAAMLSVAAPRCVAPLFAPESYRELMRLARTTPADCRDVGLECRLAADDPRIDLAVALETRLRGVPSLPPSAPRGAAIALARFRDAYENDRALRAFTRHVGLELDAQTQNAGLFAGLADGSFGDGVRQAVLAGLPPLLQAFDRSAIERFLDSLPAESVLHYFGAFAGRASGMARFNVEYRDRPAALDHLARLGTSSRQQARIEEAFSWPCRVVLALDCFVDGRAGIGARIGIELLFADEKGLAQVIELLVARGLSTPEKRDALLSWSGAIQEPRAPGSWPAALTASRRRSPSVSSVLVFKISHLKLVAEGETPFTAKAYLQLQHAWAPPLPPLTASA